MHPLMRLVENEARRARLMAAMALLILVGTLVPIATHLPFDILDSSWMEVLGYSWRGQLLFGKDILWHYGPLGFLYEGIVEGEAHHVGIAVMAIGVAIYWWAARRMLIHYSKTTDQSMFALVVMAVGAGAAVDAFWMSFPLLFLLQHFLLRPRLKEGLPWLLIAMMVVGSLVKFPFLVAALIALCVVDGYGFFLWRRVPWHMAFYVGFFAVVWLLCGQNLLYLPAFLQGAYEHSRGFGEAMANGAPVRGLLFYLLGIGIFLTGLLRAWKRIMGALTAWTLAGGIFALSYAMGRLGFTNANDYHIFAAIIFFISLILLLKDYGWEHVPKLSRKLLGGYFIAVFLVYGAYLASLPGRAQIVHFFTDSAPKIKTERDSPLTALAQVMARTRKEYPLPQVEGTADILSYGQRILFAHGLSYHPRPVFQSYHAFTLPLAKKNAQFFAGADAPRHVFFRIEPVAAHYPAQEDALSWPEFFRHYRALEMNGPYLHLVRRDKAADLGFKNLGSVEGKLGEPVAVPEGRAIWARVTTERTLAGKLLSFFLVPPYLMLEVTTSSGYTNRYRLLPEVAKAGFLLSPLVESTLQFAPLMASQHGALSPRRVEKFRLYSPRFGWLTRLMFRPEVQIAFEELELEDYPLAEVKGWNEAAIYSRLMASPLEAKRMALEDTQHQQVEYAQGLHGPRLELHSRQRLKLPLGRSEKRLKARFGGIDRGYNFMFPSKGMTLVIRGVTDKGKERKLFEAALTREEMKNGTEKNLDITWDRTHYNALVLETEPADPTTSNWIYLRDVSLK